MGKTFDLLEAAALGKTAVDRRFLQLILDEGDSAPPEILRFSRYHHSPEGAAHRLSVDPLLVDLFRHFETPEALEFYIDAIRANPEDVDDGLVQALLPFGEKAAEPLIKLYEELGEEQGSDVAFLLAALRIRSPQVFSLMLERLEYDAADGAFCLGLYGDPAARPALEKMLGEIPEDDVPLRREVQFALDQMNAPEPKYQPEHFDLLSEYSPKELPPFDILDEAERLEMLASTDSEIRGGAAYSFFNQDLKKQTRDRLFVLAQTDPEVLVRGQAWSALGDVVGGDAREETKIRDAMIAVLNDESKTLEERGGAAIGLYSVADREDVSEGLETLYEAGGKARIKALEAMWRSLWQPYAKYFPPHLNETDPAILRHALRGAGYFRQTAHIDKIASFFDREEPLDELREDALFAYALAMPGETTRGRVKGMLRKIDQLAGLDADETELVMFALDERLRLHGLAPVFEAEQHDKHLEDEHEHSIAEPVAPPAAQKRGRNDPCHCGSGKKYKKCHGAVN